MPTSLAGVLDALEEMDGFLDGLCEAPEAPPALREAAKQLLAPVQQMLEAYKDFSSTLKWAGHSLRDFDYDADDAARMFCERAWEAGVEQGNWDECVKNLAAFTTLLPRFLKECEWGLDCDAYHEIRAESHRVDCAIATWKEGA